jgi:hypothetical protein
MRWLRVDEHGFDYCYLLPDPGETDRTIVAAVAAASFNTAWPEGYGWEQWDPTGDVAPGQCPPSPPGHLQTGTAPDDV